MTDITPSAPVFIIAEIAQAHDGSLGMAHSFIDAAKACGADAVKFQTHIADVESSPQEPFRVPFSYEDKTRQDYWQRTSFTMAQWGSLKRHCDNVGIEFMSSPFSIAAIHMLEQLNMTRYKIASGEINNYLLIDTIAALNKPIILSSGLSSINDIDSTIQRIRAHHSQYSVLQCATEYPTSAESIGLNVLAQYKEQFDCPVGLSDHSGRIEPALAAVSLGASIIECHLTFDKTMFGPDARASLECRAFKQMVDGVRFIEQCLHHPIDKTQHPNQELQTMFGKSLSTNQPLAKGTTLTIDHLDTKKPANQGIPSQNYESIIGRTLIKDLDKFSFIQEEDLD